MSATVTCSPVHLLQVFQTRLKMTFDAVLCPGQVRVLVGLRIGKLLIELRDGGPSLSSVCEKRRSTLMMRPRKRKSTDQGFLDMMQAECDLRDGDGERANREWRSE